MRIHDGINEWRSIERLFFRNIYEGDVMVLNKKPMLISFHILSINQDLNKSYHLYSKENDFH